jgi:hypothetical protein
MVSIDSIVVRDDFWHGVDKPAVKAYKRELEKLIKNANNIDFSLRRAFFIGREQTDSLSSTIKREIKYCDFYLEIIGERSKPGFNQWKFIKAIDRPGRFSYQDSGSEYGDCHTRSNGKIKVIINVKNNVTTTRVSLDIQNDSSVLDFASGLKELSYKNLRNEISIKNEVERLKEVAEGLFAERQFPTCCRERKQMEILKTLLNIEETV